jgi:hypothetical protein
MRSQAGDLFHATTLFTRATSVRFGPGAQPNVFLIGYNTSGTKVRGTVSSSGTFEFPVATDSGFANFFLANLTGGASGFCYLTRLSGNFDGGGESAKITQNSGTWFLSAAAGNDDEYVRAKARCMAYDQR